MALLLFLATGIAKSGVAHFAVEDEQAAILLTRELPSHLPFHNAGDPPVAPNDGLSHPHGGRA